MGDVDRPSPLARLLPKHRRLIEASGISPEVASARGYASVTTKADLKRKGFSPSQCLVPALLVPVWDVSGEVATWQIRPDEPRMRKGKALKYETPRGAHMVLDVPPGTRERLGDPGVPLFVTEGARKADAAVTAGMACVALLGVWSWRGTNEHGGKTALPDWEAVALKGRRVCLVFDSDVTTKPEVHAALARLKAFLESRGAQVQVAYLPAGEDGAKVGLDDFLAAGNTVEDLLALAVDELRAPAGLEAPRDLPYRETASGLSWAKPTRDGETHVPLTNFSARITAEVVQNDGLETTRVLRVEGKLGDRVVPFEVPSAAFQLMAWPLEHLGAGAIVYAGLGTKDHARCAIQLLSGTPPEQHVSTHLGWERLPTGERVYLHAGGAIGAPEHAQPVVRVPEVFARYALPEPPTDRDALAKLVRLELALLDELPERLAVPLLAAVYRSVLGPADFGIHLTGQSGVFKSELCALALQHFGPGLDRAHLPGSWSSTDNALEELAFVAKDALLVIDDFAPRGAQTDVQKLHAKADRIFRAQGNWSARARLRRDGTPRPAHPPRGMILSSGEDTPAGHSLRARLLVLDVARGEIDASALSRVQRAAADGVYARALAGFLTWLAPRYDRLAPKLPSTVAKLRDKAGALSSHRRTPSLVADLSLGIALFLAFAESVGAVSKTESRAIRARCRKALLDAAAAQERHQGAAEPARRFLELLSAGLAAGRFHVRGDDEDVPENPARWGYRLDMRSDDGEREKWRATGGDRVGWVSGRDLYLDAETSYLAVQAFAQQGERVAVSAEILRRRLHEQGFLVSVDKARETLTVRRRFAGVQRSVLHLRADALDRGRSSPPTPDKPDSAAAKAGRDAASPCRVGRREPDTTPTRGAEDPASVSGARRVEAPDPTSARSGAASGNGRNVGFVGSPDTMKQPARRTYRVLPWGGRAYGAPPPGPEIEEGTV